MTLKLLLIFVLILVNGLFAMGEMAVVSARKARLQRLAKTSAGARRALLLAERPTDLLSTVQIGITLVAIITGAFGGDALSGDVAVLFAQSPVFAPYADSLGFGIVVILIAFVSLVLGELVPKRLGLTYPERIAAALSGVLLLTSRVARPAIWLLSLCTTLILRLIPGQESSADAVSDEEVRHLMREGAASGHFDAAEQQIVDQTLRLGDRRVSALMTPRTQLEVLDLAQTPEEWRATLEASRYSRFPVVDGAPDNIVGIVRVKDLLQKALAGGGLDLRAALREPLYIPETAPALKVLDQFRQSGEDLALIVDEYGDLQGLVTPADLLEALFGGDLSVSAPNEDPAWVQRGDGSWLIDGMMPLSQVHAVTGIHDFPGADEAHVQTLGGFIMSQLKRIPEPADRVALDSFILEVMDMDGRRVDKVLVTNLAEAE
ncbi:MAG: hemolysin family protein [Elstera sp.]|jgi:putative hemolysin|uniref:hemolysin family protein n=1 Tax=Elstera sp. TaxID=1916664 RepID=UPI0037BE91BC